MFNTKKDKDMSMLTKLTGAALLLMSSAAFAAPVINSTGIDGATSTITFSEVPLATLAIVTDQYAAYGATFSPFAVFNPDPGRYPTDYIGNFNGYSGETATPFVISFTTAVTGAAFDYISNTGTSLFEALLNGAVVDSFSASTSEAIGTHYGFEGISFDSIRVTAPGNHALGLDNLQLRTANVPEPGTILLMSAGLIGVFSRKRRSA
jgi:hypothetical protein